MHLHQHQQGCIGSKIWIRSTLRDPNGEIFVNWATLVVVSGSHSVTTENVNLSNEPISVPKSTIFSEFLKP